MKVKITPNPFFTGGSAERTLAGIGVGPYLTTRDGKIVCQMTQAQFDLFQIRGASHSIAIVPENEAEEPAAAPEPPKPVEVAPPFVPSITIETPTGKQTVTMPSPEKAPAPEALTPDTSSLDPDTKNMENLGAKTKK